MRRLLAFDIETAKILPAETKDVLAFRPLGITCAAGVANDQLAPYVWHGKGTATRPAGQLSKAEAGKLVAELQKLVREGYTLVSWNGLGFDFTILAEESGETAACAALALDHVDMLFHVLCTLGYPVGLQKASEGMGLPGKTAGVSGAEAPAMWAAGRHREIMDYCVQDVRLTLQLAELCEEKKLFSWVTQKGARRQLPLPHGWLSVREALKLPVPDTSWMTEPLHRSHFAGWLTPPTPPAAP